MLSLNELLIVLFKEKNEVKEYMTGKVYNKKVFLEQSLILITAEEKKVALRTNAHKIRFSIDDFRSNLTLKTQQLHIRLEDDI